MDIHSGGQLYQNYVPTLIGAVSTVREEIGPWTFGDQTLNGFNTQRMYLLMSDDDDNDLTCCTQ